MDALQKIVKVTQQQYDTLKNGGTVGGYTGLNTSYLYLVQEDYNDITYANLNSTTSLGTIGTTPKLYAVGVDASSKLAVNVPWTDTHYTNYLQINGNGTAAVKFEQNANKTLNLKPGTNVSISAASGEITISATDTTYNAATQSAAGLMSSADKTKLDGIATEATKVTSDTISGWGYTKNTGTVTSIATSGKGISGGTITSTGTIKLNSSSAGNAAANKVVIRNAAGSIQTEKLAVSSGTTTKATMQYNSTEDCIEFIFA